MGFPDSATVRGYREDRFWSFIEGGPAVRVAIFDDRGIEHARIVPFVQPWMKRRDEVIVELEQELSDADRT